MAARLTLPQQRAAETRRRIVEASRRVFMRRGYGQATVDDILDETGISRGAFYHHFSGKEDLLKAVLEEHSRSAFTHLETMGPVSSLDELIERFVEAQIDHLRHEVPSGALSVEFWALATREDWVRAPVAEFHRSLREFLTNMLSAGQGPGVVRRDLDAEAAAFLFQAIFEGTAILLAIEPDCLELERLKKPWTDLIERFIGGD